MYCTQYCIQSTLSVSPIAVWTSGPSLWSGSLGVNLNISYNQREVADPKYSPHFQITQTPLLTCELTLWVVEKPAWYLGVRGERVWVHPCKSVSQKQFCSLSTSKWCWDSGHRHQSTREPAWHKAAFMVSECLSSHHSHISRFNRYSLGMLLGMPEAFPGTCGNFFLPNHWLGNLMMRDNSHGSIHSSATYPLFHHLQSGWSL